MKKLIVPITFLVGSLIGSQVTGNYKIVQKCPNSARIYVDLGAASMTKENVRRALETLFPIMSKELKKRNIKIFPESKETFIPWVINYGLNKASSRDAPYDLFIDLCGDGSYKPTPPPSTPKPKPQPKPKPTPPPSVPSKIVKSPDTLRLVIEPIVKQPVIVPVPESISYRVPVAVYDTIRDTLQIIDTVKIRHEEPSPPGEKGLFRLDEIQGNKLYCGGFYRKENENLAAFSGGFDLRTGGKNLRANFALDAYLLFLVDRASDKNKGIIDLSAGIYNRNIGGGLHVLVDSSSVGHLGPYVEGAIGFEDQAFVLSGKLGVDFNMNDKTFTHFTEGGLTYESRSKRFALELVGRSGNDLLRKVYTNSAELNLGLGNESRLLIGFGGANSVGADEIGQQTFEQFMQGTELKYSIGGRLELSPSGRLYVKGNSKGRWDDDQNYKITEFGLEAGINF